MRDAEATEARAPAAPPTPRRPGRRRGPVIRRVPDELVGARGGLGWLAGALGTPRDGRDGPRAWEEDLRALRGVDIVANADPERAPPAELRPPPGVELVDVALAVHPGLDVLPSLRARLEALVARVREGAVVVFHDPASATRPRMLLACCFVLLGRAPAEARQLAGALLPPVTLGRPQRELVEALGGRSRP